MRTAITTIVVIAMVAGAALLGWRLLSPRIEAGQRDLDATQTVAALRTALEDGDRDTLIGLVHRDRSRTMDAVAALADRVLADLEATPAVVVEQFTEQVTTASATLTWSVQLPPDAGDLPTGDPAEAAPAQPSGQPSATSGGASTDPAPMVRISWQATASLERRTTGWVVLPNAGLLHEDLAGVQPARVEVQRSSESLGRASLLDLHGVALTNHTDLATFGFAPAQLTDRRRALATWRRTLPLSFEQFRAMVRDDSLQPTWFHPIVTLSGPDADRAWDQLRTVPGLIRRESDETATTATSLGTHVLGRVGLPTAEQVEQWGVDAGVPTGLTGLERALNDRLQDATQTTVRLVDQDEDVRIVLGSYAGDGGGPVSTSLEDAVQRAADAALTGVDQPAAIVAVRTDGGIAGSAARPLGGYNRAFEARHAPGATFFPVAAMALEASGLDDDQLVSCPTRAVVAGALLEAPRPLPPSSWSTAAGAGCATSVGAAVLALDPDLSAVAAALELLGAPDLPLATGAGTFPAPVDATELVRAAVGSGRVGMTPLQVATLGAEVAAGRKLTPWLLAEDAVDPRRLDLDVGVARAVLRRGLRGAQGSGRGLLPASRVDAVRDGWLGAIAGTGSATGDGATHAWALAVVGDLGVAVMVEDADGDEVLVRELVRRFDRELAARSPGAR